MVDDRREIKIVKKWESQNKKFTIGISVGGNLFVKCKQCDKTMAMMDLYADNEGALRKKFACPICKRKLII